MTLLTVPLFYTTFWVQVHSLPTEMYTKAMAKQFGDFIGKFKDYDAKAVAAGLRNFMRVRVEIDVHKSLRRRKKLIFASGKEVFVSFQYEKLTTFCFLCDKLGHGESYCPIKLGYIVESHPKEDDGRW